VQDFHLFVHRQLRSRPPAGYATPA
jgi:hypothetical protein